jgi:hypothetical protein
MHRLLKFLSLGAELGLFNMQVKLQQSVNFRWTPCPIPLSYR